MFKLITFSFIISILLLGCNNINTTIEHKIDASIIDKWIGKEIVIPPTVKVLDSVNNSGNKKEAGYTIVSSFDGNCANCYKAMLKLDKELIEIIGNNNVNHLYILSGYNKEILEIHLEEIKFPTNNVFFDEMDDFNEKYGFMRDPHYLNSSVLIDRNNKILCIGNPTKSIVIRKNYIELIGKL